MPFESATASGATVARAIRYRTLLALTLPLVLLVARPSSASAQDHVYPDVEWERIADPAEVGWDTEGLEELRAYLETLNTTSMMVIVGGRVLFEYGDITLISYLASVRKSILAMLYGNHVADGTIDLSKTLRELGMDDHGGLLEIELGAQVEHLITARSGIYHEASNSGDNLAQAPPRGSQRPGEYHLYSNWDFNAAGGAFELMTGRDIYDALQSDIAIPVGMQEFERERHRKSGNLERSRYPAYHINLSTRDMARVGYLMLREGRWEDRQLVPRDWTHEIVSVVTPVEEMNPVNYRNGPFGYGYMWWVWDGPDARGAYEGAYTGIGAVGQYITVLPKLDMVVVHKTDRRGPGSVSRSEYLAALDMVVEARSVPSLEVMRVVSNVTGPWLGQTPPGDQPEIFAPGIVSTGMYERDMAAMPDGRELYFTVVHGNFAASAIAVTRETEQGWTMPQLARFSDDPRYRFIEPAISPDGRYIYFASDRSREPDGERRSDMDIWMAERDGDGWGEPRNLDGPVNTDDGEFFPSLTRSGTLYFCRQNDVEGTDIIFRARPDDRGGFLEPERLPAQVNAGQLRYNAFVDPDERYLILAVVGLPDSRGSGDYYVVFSDRRGGWWEPINLGDAINTASGQEYSPYVSPDGEYFFFMSARTTDIQQRYAPTLTYGRLQDVFGGPGNGLPDIWWVKADFIMRLWQPN